MVWGWGGVGILEGCGGGGGVGGGDGVGGGCGVADELVCTVGGVS